VAGLTLLANDVLFFLGSTVIVIPLFNRFNISPVLGFLASGFLLTQFGLTQDIDDLEKVSELGVLFLLFEMGLELSLERLQALAKYAFGLGTLQMVLCTAIFTGVGLPVFGGAFNGGESLVTGFLEDVAKAPHALVSIRSLDEAIVIGAALSLSSSAFVLQLLSERGELPTRLGAATLGILLLQDIAVVPFLVLLPLIESSTESTLAGATPVSLISSFLPTALSTIAGLGVVLVGGRVVLRRVFEVVAESRNTEAFLALCLLTVAGAAYASQALGFSDTMGAFLAGVLLAETNYKTQVEADIKPFRGLLLGLFFTATGGSIDLEVLKEDWFTIAWLLAGLLSTKTAVIATLGRGFGLTSNESIRLGFLLSQGGEFAFVLLSLAAQLKVLPEDLNRVLIIVVVLSMALTPGLAEIGKIVGDWLSEQEAKRGVPVADDYASPMGHAVLEDPIVICGFGPQSQLLANLLENPLIPGKPSYVVFDLDPQRAAAARTAGFPVIYGDGSRANVLAAAGVTRPRAFVVCHRNKEQARRVVTMAASTFAGVPVYATGVDFDHAAELEAAGALSTVVSSSEAGLSLGCKLLVSQLGMTTSEVAYLKANVDSALARRTKMAPSRPPLVIGAVGAEGGADAQRKEILVLDPGSRGKSTSSRDDGEPSSSSAEKGSDEEKPDGASERGEANESMSSVDYYVPLDAEPAEQKRK